MVLTLCTDFSLPTRATFDRDHSMTQLVFSVQALGRVCVLDAKRDRFSHVRKCCECAITIFCIRLEPPPLSPSPVPSSLFSCIFLGRPPPLRCSFLFFVWRV